MDRVDLDTYRYTCHHMSFTSVFMSYDIVELTFRVTGGGSLFMTFFA